VQQRVATSRADGRARVENLERRRVLASVASTVPINGAQSASTTANLTVTFGEAMNASTLTASRIVLRDNAGTVLSSTLTYNATTRVLTIDPAANLVANAGYYTVRITGGSAGVIAADGSTLPSDVAFSFSCGTPNFSVQNVGFTGLVNPTNVEFSPDGRVYVAEKSGLIKLFDNLADTTPTVVADFRTQVHNYWDRGLLGMALDPAFTTGRPYIYVLYTYDGTKTQAAPVYGTVGGTDDGSSSASNGSAPASGRLSRFMVGANGLISGSEEVLVHDFDIQFPSHSIGDLKFGPDGYLYASCGDGASFNAVDYGNFGNPFGDPTNEGGALRAQDALSTGDAQALAGSIIRIDPNTGAGAPGNPYISSTDANRKRLLAFGLRNPFRITFKPGSNELWAGDVGWNTWEEINRIPNVTNGVANNFGWPAFEGNARQSGYEAANLPLLQGLYASGGDTKPYFAWNHSAQVVSGSGEPTGGSSAAGVAFYNGGNYPAAYNGALFFSDYSRSRVYVMYQGPDGNPLAGSRQVFSAPGFGSVELQIGPNGDLFSVDLLGNKIVRYVATGYNQAPTARITSDRTTGGLPFTVNFDGRTSSDPDVGDVLTYSWDLNGDGTFGDSTSPNPSFTYNSAGVVNVQLRVTDRGGATSTASLQVRPGATPPVPTISTPTTSLRWKVGDTVTVSGSATDAEDGTLAGSSLRWDVYLVHANEIDPTNTHLHEVTSFTGTSGSFLAPEHEFPSWVELRLTATDSTGLSTTVTRRLDPLTTTLNFASNPAGLQIAVNGTVYTTPFSRTAIVGSTSSITALSPQTLGSNTYSFNSWSQGGAASQSIVAGTASSSYTATFDVSTNVKVTGSVIGTAGSLNNDPAVDKSKVFDGNFATYFDANVANGAWVGLDLGTAKSISRIRFAPRDGYPGRMVGGKFQASNDANFASGVVDLYTVPSAPAANAWSDIAVGALANTSGLSAEYFNSLDFTGAPIYRVDPQVNFDWGTGSPGAGINADQFSARWTGQLLTVEPGTYQFRVTADDGVRLWVNNTQILDAWVDQSPTTYTVTSVLGGSGRVNIRMEYYEKTGGATAKLEWMRPGQTAFSAIPASNLFAGPYVAPTSTYRYVRYLAPNDGYGNISELEFYTPQTGSAPAAPSSLVATGATGAINLTWADNSNNETSFSVERRLGSTGTWSEIVTLPAGSTSYADGTVAASTTYDYRVRARNAIGDSSYSNIASATSGGPVVTIPSAPTTATATAASGTQVNVSWVDNSNNETQFIVERSTGAGSTSFAQVGSVGANTTTFSDTTVAAGTTYVYRVYAKNTAGNSAYSNTTQVTTPAPSGLPAAPSAFTAALLAGSQVRLNWTDNANNETGFNIERRYAGWIWETLTTVGANVATYTDTTSFAGVVYEYRIRSTNASGQSAWVDGLTVDTSGAPQPPAAPSGLVATAASSTRIDLVWDDNSTNETGFKVERRLLGGTFAQIATTAANVRTYADTTVAAGNVYEYRVRATTGTLDSAYTSVASATTPGGAGGVPNAPSAVSLTLLTTPTGPNVRVNWTDGSSNEIGFRVQRRYAGWIWEDIGNVGANVSTYTDTTSIGGVVYEYRVVALGSGGNSPESAGVLIST
jgi:glucose/arabinose dehydrogenase